jgi:uncharacterized protein involved in exopolysaccharide biosynthesis
MRISIYIAVFTALIALTTYAFLAQLSPRYRGEATILVDAGDPRLEGIDAPPPAASGLRPDVAAAQLQLLRSGDLARTVTQSLRLARRSAFASVVDGGSIASDVLTGIGLRPDPMRLSPEERILATFDAHLSVSALDDAPVIAVAFTSTDPQVAADVANAVATEYVALQQAASGDMAAEATSRLEADIAGLGGRIAATEARIEAYSSGIDRLSGSAPPATDLARQQRAEAQLRDDLRDLENEAASQRASLDSYVRRYREVLARRQGGFLPVDARILSRASAPLEPYFPRKTLIAAIVGALAFLAMLVFVGVRELGRGRQRQRLGRVPLPEVADAVPIGTNTRWRDDRRIMPPVPTFADTAAGGGIGDSSMTTVSSMRTSACLTVWESPDSPGMRRRSSASKTLARNSSVASAPSTIK